VSVQTCNGVALTSVTAINPGKFQFVMNQFSDVILPLYIIALQDIPLSSTTQDSDDSSAHFVTLNSISYVSKATSNFVVLQSITGEGMLSRASPPSQTPEQNKYSRAHVSTDLVFAVYRDPKKMEN
jgi:hypothetical protein